MRNFTVLLLMEPGPSEQIIQGTLYHFGVEVTITAQPGTWQGGDYKVTPELRALIETTSTIAYDAIVLADSPGGLIKAELIAPHQRERTLILFSQPFHGNNKFLYENREKAYRRWGFAHFGTRWPPKEGESDLRLFLEEFLRRTLPSL